jgi:hypothetical protein
MAAHGVILGLLTAMTARLLREGRWLFFPVVLQALQIGFRSDGLYIADVAGATVLVVGMYAVLTVLDRLVGKLPKATVAGHRSHLGVRVAPWQRTAGPLTGGSGGGAKPLVENQSRMATRSPLRPRRMP